MTIEPQHIRHRRHKAFVARNYEIMGQQGRNPAQKPAFRRGARYMVNRLSQLISPMDRLDLLPSETRQGGHHVPCGIRGCHGC